MYHLQVHEHLPKHMANPPEVLQLPRGKAALQGPTVWGACEVSSTRTACGQQRTHPPLPKQHPWLITNSGRCCRHGRSARASQLRGQSAPVHGRKQALQASFLPARATHGNCPLLATAAGTSCVWACAAPALYVTHTTHSLVDVHHPHGNKYTLTHKHPAVYKPTAFHWQLPPAR